MYRQGDILIIPVAAEQLPDGVDRFEPVTRDGRGRIVLALGEATGHAHALSAAGELLRRPGLNPLEPSWLHLPSGGRLTHEEHAAISLPKGWYRVVRQREYVPGAVRPVAD